jgi:cobalt-zinc-cadmium efflux system protein
MAMSTPGVALTAPLVMPEGNDDRFLAGLREELEHKFGINHTTLQIENEQIDEDCM